MVYLLAFCFRRSSLWFIGAFLGWSAVYLLILYTTPLILSWLGEVSLLPISLTIMLFILATEMLGGMIIGGLGGFLSTHRFLRN